MKKLLKFNNLIGLLGIINVLLFLTPCFEIKDKLGNYLGWVNLFTGTFGGNFGFASYPDYRFVLCAGLLVSFIFAIVAILLCFVRNKMKLASLLACPLFITAGVLTCCANRLIYYANINVSMGTAFTVNDYPWLIVIGVIFFVLAAFTLIDFIIAVAKPKQKEVY